MKAKVRGKIGALDMKALARDIRVVWDVESGKRKDFPRSWSRTNVVDIPTPIWIRAVRRRFKLSLHDFGGLVGLQAADIKAWETGKEVPDAPASRLMGLLAQKPHLVKFMQSAWKDDGDSRALGRKKAIRNS